MNETNAKLIVGILGCGVIGNAIRKGFVSKGHQVKVHDLKFNSKLSDLYDCDVIFVCLPTPTTADGNCNVSIIENSLGVLSDDAFTGIICIKSTVEPGFSSRMASNFKNLTIVNCPEFLRERSAFEDFIDYGLCIIGSDDAKDAAEKIKNLHEPFTREFCFVSLTEAELIKYFHNTYNALRIVFANSFFDLCTELDAKYENVLAAVTKRNNIGTEYLRCNNDLRGFAGSCLPKDTEALANLVERLGLNRDVWAFIISENQKFEKTVFDGMRK